MARRHYHRDLLGTTFTIAGLALVLGTWLVHVEGRVALLAAFALVTLVATWLARQLYEDLTVGEAMFASALVVAALFGYRTWHTGERASTEAVGWAAAAIAVGSAMAWIAMRRPGRSLRMPRKTVGGLVAVAGHLVPGTAAIALGASETWVVAIALTGGVFGGVLAIRVVPEATPSQIGIGTTLAVIVATSGPPILEGVWSVLFGIAIFAPIWAAFAMLGAWMAKPRRRGPELPNARAT